MVIADTHLPRVSRRLSDECMHELEHADLILHAGDVTAASVLRAPRDDYTRMLIRAVPSLTPPARPPVTQAPVVLATKHMSKSFTVGGWFARAVWTGAADDGAASLTLGAADAPGVLDAAPDPLEELAGALEDAARAVASELERLMPG